jgi:hypothetical protein
MNFIVSFLNLKFTDSLVRCRIHIVELIDKSSLRLPKVVRVIELANLKLVVMNSQIFKLIAEIAAAGEFRVDRVAQLSEILRRRLENREGFSRDKERDEKKAQVSGEHNFYQINL